MFLAVYIGKKQSHTATLRTHAISDPLATTSQCGRVTNIKIFLASNYGICGQKWPDLDTDDLMWILE